MRKTRNRRKQKGGWVVWTRRVKTCKKKNDELNKILQNTNTWFKENRVNNEFDDKFVDIYDLITNKLLIIFKKTMLDRLLIIISDINLIWMFGQISKEEIISLIRPRWITDFNNILSDKFIKEKCNILGELSLEHIIVALDHLFNSINKENDGLFKTTIYSKLNVSISYDHLFKTMFPKFKEKYSLTQTDQNDLPYQPLNFMKPLDLTEPVDVTEPVDLTESVAQVFPHEPIGPVAPMGPVDSDSHWGPVAPLSQYLQCIIDEEIIKEKIKILTFIISLNNENDESENDESTKGEL
jgi:hypothetical protein